MVVCSSKPIAYKLLKIFQDKYPEWFIEKKTPDGVTATAEELRELKEMPCMAMVASVGKNDEQEMYDYLGGVKNAKRSEKLDAAFKQDKSNFRIVIVVDMWIFCFVLCVYYTTKTAKSTVFMRVLSDYPNFIFSIFQCAFGC